MERTYTIPLRKEFLKSPKYKRAKKSVIAVHEFLSRHMRSDNVKLGKFLNLELWKHGINNPPSRIRVSVTKDDKGVVSAELVGAPVEKKTEEPKKGVLEKVKEKVVGKPESK